MAAQGTTSTAQPPGSGLLIIERILRDRDSIWRQIGEERDLGKLTLQMLASSVLALACYGAVLGSSHSPAQAGLSALKLPLLFLMTLAICLPTLYLFNLVFGARLQVRQALALVMVTITVTAVLSLAFAPISLFFLLTAFSYSFYKILNVAILTMTAFVGLKFLTSGMHALNAHTAKAAAERQERAEAAEAAAVAELANPSADAPVSPAPAGTADAGAGTDEGKAAVPAASVSAGPAVQPQPNGTVAVQTLPAHPPKPLLLPDGRYAYPVAPPLPAMRTGAVALPAGERPASMTLLHVWILLFGFVGTQLAWTLRPFVGEPHEPFEVFRKIEGNFYVNIIHTIGELF
ncbi:hypothetical protein ACFO1B_25145 [Dactylosporangium siamense]|uniref:Uncharacterized protein n=1 Tax=Dactylosporangium siamense TaxID=685454 RepID=A0A919PNV7_9ACTN|nr:hypothetical protein [Dactylosporangium siamense]GIG47414.1 hypothetical protein Dsi01nite_054550 [Dactylosporangium siamense]